MSMMEGRRGRDEGGRRGHNKGWKEIRKKQIKYVNVQSASHTLLLTALSIG